jgi:hypothetical protein
MNARLCLPLVLLTVLGACVSPENREPIADGQVVDDWGQRGVVEIAVLPIESLIPEQTIPDLSFTFPEIEARRQFRLYLIEKRDYSVPRASFVDAAGDRGPEDSDAILISKIDQWDASQLGRRGVIYAGGTFLLRDRKSGEELWSFRCQDRQISVSAPHGGYSAERNMNEAAKFFAAEVLGRMPRKTDFDPDWMAEEN